MSSVSLKHGDVTPVEIIPENMYLQQLSQENDNEARSFASLDRSCVSIKQQSGQSIRRVRVAPKDGGSQNDNLWRNYTGNDKESCAKSSRCCGSELRILRKLVAALFFVSMLTLLLTLLVISGRVKAKSMYCSCENTVQQEGKSRVDLFPYMLIFDSLSCYGHKISEKKLFLAQMQTFFSFNSVIHFKTV